MEITPDKILLLIVIAALLATGGCILLFASIFAFKLRRALRHIYSKFVALDSQLAALQTELRNFQETLKNDLSLLHFRLGRPGEPSDIVISESDTYEKLDRNWGSVRDTEGRQESLTVIDGERNRTAVIVILGQSNAANHGSGRYAARQNVDNFNIYDGKCYHAADPLLGASGDGGNFATRLGDKLIEAGLFDRVVLAPIAMGGTAVEQWADEGMFNRRIPVLIRRLHDAGLKIDFILWHQGEGNNGLGDGEGRQYRKNLLEVISTFRRHGVNAPFFVALVTLCGGPHPNAENIRAGQKGTVDPKSGIFLGPDTDTIGLEHRWDTCHFSESGLDMAATLWFDVIAEFQSKTAANKHPTNFSDLPSLARQTIMSRLGAAFAIEKSYKPITGPIVLVNDRLEISSLVESDVSRYLAGAEIRSDARSESESAEIIIGFEGLRNAFHPRAALDSICGQLRAGGRLIYAQRLGGVDYLGLTPKWFLDYFLAARYADCRIYLIWPPDREPKVATFDYNWMLDKARPVYNPMWDNITYSAAIVVVAEKGTENHREIPSQDIYRPADEWENYAAGLRRLAASSRPYHVIGQPPEVLPAGYRGIA